MGQTLYNLDNLTGYDFEDLVARIMKKLGYKDIKVTQKSGDKGKDIIMRHEDRGEFYPVVVECKHQGFVGRPVVQKLISAMWHEKKNNPFIKGIIVTSGRFSPSVQEYIDEMMEDSSFSSTMKLELIDGKKLKKLCEEYNIIVLNGKIQIITNESVDFLGFNDVKDNIFKEFSKIIGSQDKLLSFKSKNTFYPCYYMRYNIDSEFCTKAGCVNTIKKTNEKIFLDGAKEGCIDTMLRFHFFEKGFPKIIEIKREKYNKLIPFEFTEKDIEDIAFDIIRDENTEEVTYQGKNNVEYTKTCKPNSRNIELKEARAIYLPKIVNQIKIKDQKYNQEFFSNKHKLHYKRNELGECKECHNSSTLFNSNLYFCIGCGKILCSTHKRLDAFDGTPVCLKCADREKLILQTKFFISEKNKNKYLKNYGSMGPLRRFYEDKIAFWGSVGSIILAIVVLVFMLYPA